MRCGRKGGCETSLELLLQLQVCRKGSLSFGWFFMVLIWASSQKVWKLWALLLSQWHITAAFDQNQYMCAYKNIYVPVRSEQMCESLKHDNHQKGREEFLPFLRTPQIASYMWKHWLKNERQLRAEHTTYWRACYNYSWKMLLMIGETSPRNEYSSFRSNWLHTSTWNSCFFPPFSQMLFNFSQSHKSWGLLQAAISPN